MAVSDRKSNERTYLVASESVVWNEFDEDEERRGGEAFITLPKPLPFTRAKVDAVERRPAAVLTMCQFLNSLTNQCKADIAKLGCIRIQHGHVPQDKPVIDTGRLQPMKRVHRHSKEAWDKRMLRLKCYQRAFSAIVIHFKAYSPALFYIKKTYEDMLSYRIQQIKIAHFEKKRLHIQKYSMRKQMNDYQFPEYPQLLKAEKYLTILRQRISLQEEAIKVITGILNKMEQALSDHFERHRDLEEQIIMVDTEIANRRQKAFSMREKEEKEGKEKSGTAATENAVAFLDSDEEDIDDPYHNNLDDVDEERRMVWIMAFAICHKDLEDAERKLTLFQTKYQHVVPRHEHENMKRNIKDEKVSAKSLADEKSFLEEELSQLKVLEERLKEELGHIKTQLTDLRITVTPRPSWEYLGEFIQGGVPKWEKMIQGKSTKDVTEKLFMELRSRRGGEKFLQPLGTESTVLKCLRFGKRVPDRQLHSRDAALMINDIWASRKKALDENLNAPPKQDDFDFGKPVENIATKSFADFVTIYFEERYEDIDQRMEWTYNLIECCKRFSLDYRLIQFLNVMQGQFDENIYFVTRSELFRVRNTLLQKSVDEDMSRGMLSSNQFVEALEQTFPYKSEADFQSIIRVTNKLNAELKGEGADLSSYYVTEMIDVRDDGFRGAFVSEIVKQFEEGRQQFVDKIIEELASILDISPASAGKENDIVADKDVYIVQVYKAIKRADPDIEKDKIGAALACIFTGTSVLPGGGVSTSRLINYVSVHSDDGENESSEAKTGEVGHMDDENFERAIKDVLRDDDDEGEQQISEAQKKAFYKALKHAKLRTVVKRLRGSFLIPSWQSYDPSGSVLPDGPVDVNLHLGVGGLAKTFVNKKDIAPLHLEASDGENGEYVGGEAEEET